MNNLKFTWNEDFRDVVLAFEAVSDENTTTLPLWIVLTVDRLYVIETTNAGRQHEFDVASHEFRQNDDSTSVKVEKPFFNYEVSLTRIFSAYENARYSY